MTDPLARLSTWLQPHTVTMNAETFQSRKAVVEKLAASELDATALICTSCQLLPTNPELLQSSVTEGDPSLVVESNEPLIAVLAAAAVISRLADRDRKDRALHALLVQSALFVGLEPAVDSLPAAAADALADVGRRERRRLEPENTSREVARLLTEAKLAADATDDADSETIVAAIQARDSALRALARRVEDLVGLFHSRLELLEEELDLLWWSRRGRPRGSEDPWECIEPPARAARAACDVAALLARQPAPPSVRSLLRAALGTAAEADATIAEVATALELPARARKDRLAPLTTYRLILDEVGGHDDAASDVFQKAVAGISAGTTRKLVDLADQALRELQIAGLL